MAHGQLNESGCRYAAYGLGIHSSIRIHGLTKAPAGPDLVIQRGTVALGQLEALPEGGRYSASPTEVILAYDEVGAIRISAGREIVVDALDGADEAGLGLALLGPGLGIALHQRGLLVLHASAVAMHGGAVGFLGGSGWGKSTMAAMLHARGHRLVCDDVMVLEAGSSPPLVFPGYPRLKLWPDAAAAVGDDAETLPLLVAGATKRWRSAGRDFESATLPLRALYVLDFGERTEVSLVAPSLAVKELAQHAYAWRLLQPTGTTAAFFRRAVDLVRKVPLRRLTRPVSLATLDKVAELVERDVAGMDRSDPLGSARTAANRAEMPT